MYIDCFWTTGVEAALYIITKDVNIKHLVAMHNLLIEWIFESSIEIIHNQMTSERLTCI